MAPHDNGAPAEGRTNDVGRPDSSCIRRSDAHLYDTEIIAFCFMGGMEVIATIDLSACRLDLDGTTQSSTGLSLAETTETTQNSSDREHARQLVHALRTLGCVRLVNHGMDETLLERVFQASRRFFGLDESIKTKYAYQGHESNRGYIGYGKESHSLTGQQQTGTIHSLFDRKETFDIGKENEARFRTPWPTELNESFRDDLLAYYQGMDQLHLKMLRLIAVGLGLEDPNYFVDRCNEQHCNLRLLHYPQEHVAHDTDTMDMDDNNNKNGDQVQQHRTIIRGARHTDFGTLTLLLQDGTGGLRVETRSGDWIFIEAIPGSIIVQVGDMLQRWTGDVLRAAPHQVVQPLATGEGILPERFSIAFFCNANKSVMIDTLDLPGYGSTTTTTTTNSQYDPINSVEYLTQRLTETIQCERAPQLGS